MTARQDLAAAASSVAGVKVGPYYRQTTKTGDGWVELQRSDRDDTGFGFMDRWAVKVITPQDLRAAEEWIESKREALTAALAPHMVVTALVPAVLVIDQGSVPGLVIEGSRAH